MTLASPPLVSGRPADELVATVALLHGQIVPQNLLASIIETHGSAVDLVHASYELDFGTSPLSQWLSGKLSASAVAEAHAQVKAWKARGDEVVSILDPQYPSGLREIYNRPPLLFVRGSLASLEDRPSVAIVGARNATTEGRAKAAAIARQLAADGLVIVSGLAAGIDTAAHEAALEAGGLTIAVMGTGLDTIYPAANAPLAERIVASGGALTTQFLPPQRPAKWSFPMRNVTMSGLAMATIVVEASATSGARQQARSALEHGRPVFLLRSLVQSHEWAKTFATLGHRGSRALVIDDPADFLNRVRDFDTEQPLLVG